MLIFMGCGGVLHCVRVYFNYTLYAHMIAQVYVILQMLQNVYSALIFAFVCAEIQWQ